MIDSKEIEALKELDGTQFFISQANLNRSYSEEYYKLTGYRGVQAIVQQLLQALGYGVSFYSDSMRIMPDGTADVYGLYMGISMREWIDMFPNVDIDLCKSDPDGSSTKREKLAMDALMRLNPTKRVAISDGMISVSDA